MPTGNLPAEAKKIFESVYREAKNSGDSEATAAQKAWGAVKRTWKKIDGKWVKKGPWAEFSMYITKASVSNGVMKWSAVNSDTDYDSYQERMSLELYRDFISHIENEEEIPEKFRGAACSEYWCGGMPYLSVSHYPDLNGEAVPGEPLELFVDGDEKSYRLKARGVLFDSPLGHSVYRSLKQDKVKPSDEKIRISIGFLDLGHRHGDGEVWTREGLYSLCPECLEGVGDKVYVKGYLVHLALTRVPVNKRTEMVLEEKSEMAKKKTRKEDAASIVGSDLAEELDAKQKVSKQRSDVLIEMSEGEEPTEEETQELVSEIEEPAAEPRDVAPVEEPVGEVAEKVEKASVEKFEDATMDKVANEAPAYVDNLPYGGATSMRDAEKYVAAKNEAIYLMDAWSIFSNVVWNIFERGDVKDKREVLQSAINEFSNVLATKAMLSFGETERANGEDHQLRPAIDGLLAAVENSLSVEGDINARLQFIQPTLQELGETITDYVRKSDVNEPPAPNDNNENLVNQITELIQPLSESLRAVNERLGILEAKSGAQKVEPRSRIPQPRTAPASLVAKTESPTKPGSLKSIIRKSVGIE